MSFAESEASLDEGEPYELHEFRLGETSTYWRYADAPADISYGGNTFTSVYIQGDPIESGVNAIKSRTTVRTGWDNPFAAQYKVCPPDEIIHYTRYKGHAADVELEYTGDVLQVFFRQESPAGASQRAEIIIDPYTASLQRTGLVTQYSRTCQTELFGEACGVDRDAYKVLGTLDSVSGLDLVSSTFGTTDPYTPEIRGDITGLPECTYNASTSMNYATTPAEAFDNLLPPNHYWASSSSVNQWVSCHWATGKRIRQVNIQPCHAIGWSQYNPRHIKIEGSNNGIDWVKIPINHWYSSCSAYNTDEAEIAQINNYNDWAFLRLDNSTLYSYYRVFCSDTWGGSGFMAIAEIEMREDDTLVDAYLKGGDIIINGRRRKIVDHQGDTVTLSSFIPGLAAGDLFDAAPGCNHLPGLTGDCHARFSNYVNGPYRGQPNIPDDNPFSQWGILA